MSFDLNKMSLKQIVSLSVAGVFLIIGLLMSGSLVEYVDASDIVLIQSLGGDLTWHTQSGPVWQGLGKVTVYPKRGTIRFDVERDSEGNIVGADGRLPIQFYDGGKGTIEGSINYELPLIPDQLTELHSKFNNPDALVAGLIKPALNKTIYMTGSLMSSHESYKEKRTQLLQYVDDMIQNGVYLLEARQVEQTDPISGERRTMVISEITRDAQGQPRRAEEGQLKRFQVKAFNFSIENLDYTEAVDQQITQQQQITMAVQTAMAKAREAEQNKLTANAEGEAAAMKTKWEQEQINAKIISQADGEKRAAELRKQAAEFTRQEQILLGQGEAERKRLVMSADGALEKKLDAWLKSQEMWAAAFKGYPGALVPSVVMGQGASTGASSVGSIQQFMDVLGAKAAKDLSLDMQVPRGPISSAPQRGASQRGN